jgi:hypothetical protein
VIRSSRRRKRRSALAKVWFWMWMHGPLRPRKVSLQSMPVAVCLVLGMDAARKAL